MDLTDLSPEEIAVRASRRALAHVYLKGQGVEVGAGNRPVLLPNDVRCFYGDIRDQASLESYFEDSSSRLSIPSFLDAQTLDGIDDQSLDFVISAHVIEHLHDALGSFRNSIRVLKPSGIFMLIVPDKRFTFDHLRRVTSISHFEADALDGGQGTLLEAYREHGRYIHPTFATALTEEEIEAQAQTLFAMRADTHFHTWDTESLRNMIDHECNFLPIDLIALVPIINENVAIIQKKAS